MLRLAYHIHVLQLSIHPLKGTLRNLFELWNKAFLNNLPFDFRLKNHFELGIKL